MKPAPRCPNCGWSLAFRPAFDEWEGYCWNENCPRDTVAPDDARHIDTDPED